MRDFTGIHYQGLPEPGHPAFTTRLKSIFASLDYYLRDTGAAFKLINEGLSTNGGSEPISTGLENYFYMPGRLNGQIAYGGNRLNTSLRLVGNSADSHKYMELAPDNNTVLRVRDTDTYVTPGGSSLVLDVNGSHSGGFGSAGKFFRVLNTNDSLELISTLGGAPYGTVRLVTPSSTGVSSVLITNDLFGPSDTVTITSHSISVSPLTIKGKLGQTDNLQQWCLSTGGVMTAIGASGQLTYGASASVAESVFVVATNTSFRHGMSDANDTFTIITAATLTGGIIGYGYLRLQSIASGVAQVIVDATNAATNQFQLKLTAPTGMTANIAEFYKNVTLLSYIDANGAWNGPVNGSGSSLFDDSLFAIYNHTTTTKKIAFSASSISAATTRTITVPDASGTLAYINVQQTFTQQPVFDDGGGGNITLNTPNVGGDIVLQIKDAAAPSTNYLQLLAPSTAMSGANTIALPVGANATLAATTSTNNFSASSIKSGAVNLTAQTADITATAITLTPSSATPYLVEVFVMCTTADAAAGTITVTIGWTDAVGATTQAAVSGFSLATTGRTSGSVFLRRSSGNITYAVTHTGTYGTAQYALYVRALGMGV